MSYSIEIHDLSKQYKSGRTTKERFKEWFIPFYKSKHKAFDALKNISFKIRNGEAVGIIGMNGAGKSTLLKLITGTTSPTNGTITTSGRIVALLELGMGFHPEFSGRENIMLAGQLIGFSAAEIKAKFKEIEDFAEIGKFIDAPVRTYSSGMQMRLAFSLATAVRPDILIVDEALSVGDAYFQQKSFARIRQFKEAGTTLLFVSHDKSAVLTLCDRALLMNKGEILLDAAPAVVMDYYNSLIAEKSGDESIRQYKCGDKVKTISGDNQVFFKEVFLENEKGEKVEYVTVGEKIKLVADIYSEVDEDNLVYGFLIKSRTGMEVYGTNTFLYDKQIVILKNEQKKLVVEFVADIGPGIYSITVALHTGRVHVMQNYNWLDLAVTFTVINTSKHEFVGVASLKPKFNISGEKHVS